MRLLQGAQERVDILQISPDGRLAAAYPGGVQLWNSIADGSRPATVLRHPLVRSFRFTPDGQKLLIGGPWQVVHDLATGQAAEVSLEKPRWETFHDLSPDGRLLLIVQGRDFGEPPGQLSCRPLDDLATLVWTIDVPRLICGGLLFLADGERFVLFERSPDGDPSRVVCVTRNVRDGHILTETTVEKYDFSTSVMSGPLGLVAARRGSSVAVFRANDFRAAIKIRNDNRKHFTGLAFHPSGQYLGTTSNDATVTLHDTTTWKVARAFKWDIGRHRLIAFSSDGMLAATGGDEGKIFIWDVDL